MSEIEGTEENEIVRIFQDFMEIQMRDSNRRRPYTSFSNVKITIINKL